MRCVYIGVFTVLVGGWSFGAAEVPANWEQLVEEGTVAEDYARYEEAERLRHGTRR